MLFGKDGFGLRRGPIGNTMKFRWTKQFVLAIVTLLGLSRIATAQWSEGVAIASDKPPEPFSSAIGEADFLQAMKNHLAAYQEELDATNSHESLRANN